MKEKRNRKEEEEEERDTEGKGAKETFLWEQAGNDGPIRYETSECTTYPKRDAP